MHQLQPLLILVLYFHAAFSCNNYTTCEDCAGKYYNYQKCRWCLSSNSCVASKYECQSNWYTLSSANCPNQRLPPIPYNDSFVRTEVTFFTLAVTRWNSSMDATTIEGDTQQCLDRIHSGIKIWAGFRVETFNGKHPNTGVIFVDDSTQRIWLCFRGTLLVNAFFAQGFLMGLRYTKTIILAEAYPVEMNKYYGDIYEEFCNAGLSTALEQVIKAYPNYQLLTCGHSLGGSLSNIFALHIALKFNKPVYDYSMSGPRAGGEEFALLHAKYVYSTYRIIRDGDWVPDLPFRNSELQFAAYHPSYEIFYESQMDANAYTLCLQPDGEKCNKGHWIRKFTSHLYLFDQSFQTWHLGKCLQ